MDHDGGHSDHGDGHDGEHRGGDHGGGEGSCSMNMLFNWDTENLCVVFESWKINTPLGLIFSCLIVIGLAASYELLRAQSRLYEERLREGARKRHGGESTSTHAHVGSDISHDDEEPLLPTRNLTFRLLRQQQLTRALFYMAQVFVGFFLMLIFMTYNGYLMASTVIGAGLGFYCFGGDALSSTKALSCH
ncbi:hypothetical protein BX616_006951 [Lobosporangium transversale]|uniref:Copper transport protein n=1 Tax=Lobosporangium transversale TaxID=64571 RepID=A0A1Y2GV84_9FUNG|nr:Ctr copper transporter family-domain-containing protein [Lobosporangium transversale]KAF9915078.1 hypothetical protein BX616_006951 [Lobosporangium transversale]ORZ23675.1 Ctr copper transporter family-domain-containing protein [Lobosporangium transversale]|eukprot:XP_021883489.1 Ctr copper transporter family-domain-containing protein [Lobosporangium transversale]